MSSSYDEGTSDWYEESPNLSAGVTTDDDKVKNLHRFTYASQYFNIYKNTLAFCADQIEA